MKGISLVKFAENLPDVLIPLKVVNGASFDITKITRASLLFQADFPKMLF